MKRLIFLFILCAMSFSLYGQNYEWIKQYGRSGRFVTVEEISESVGAQVIVGGVFEEIIFKDSTYEATMRTSNSRFENIYVASYNTDGSENWIRTFLSTNNIVFVGMDVDALGNIYMLFEAGGSVTSGADTFLQDADPSYEGGYQVLKLDPMGNLLWRNDQFAQSEDLENRGSDIELSDIAVAPNGELYLALSFEDDHSLSNGLSFSASNGEGDPLLIKYQSNGQIAWAIQGESQWNEEVFEDDKSLDIEIDSDGNVLMAGTFIDDGSESFGLRFGSLPRLSTAQSGDGVFLAKFSSAGAPLWLKGFADDATPNMSGSEEEQLMDIVVDGTDILMSIHFNDDLIIGTDTLNNLIDNGGFPYNGNAIIKLDENGDLIWVQQINGGDLFNQIGVDPVNDQYAVLGNYTKVSFDGTDISLEDDRNDFYLALYDENGSLISVDTTEYITNGGNTIGEKYPMEYLSDGTLMTTMIFGGPGSFTTNPNPPPYGQVVFGNITLDTVYTVLAKMDFNNVPGVPTVDLGPDVVQCEGTVTLDAGIADTYLWSTGETSQSITVDSTGNYAVQISDDMGQTASDTVYIEINQSLVFSFPDTIIGFNRVILESPVAAASYLWSTEETTNQITVDSTGYFSLLVTTEKGCESIDSVYVSIEELSVFKGGAGSGNAQIELINEAGFYIGGAGSGSDTDQLMNNSGFYNGGGGSGYTFQATSEQTSFYGGGTAAGYSEVTVMNTNGFYFGGVASGDAQNSLMNQSGFYKGGIGSGDAMAEMINEIITKINEGVFKEAINIYPNPARRIVKLDNGNKEVIKAEVYSLSGVRTLEKTFGHRNQIQEINVELLPKGTYLIMFYTTENTILYSKLIKE